MKLLGSTPDLARAARDALSVLAHLLLRFDRPADAAALLVALDRLGAEPGWAGRCRCVALLALGRLDEVEALAGALLASGAEEERALLLQIMARACWRGGRHDEARAYAQQSRAAFGAVVLGPARPGAAGGVP